MIPDFPVGPVPKRGVSGVSRILAVASGKGGVGKSTTAVNLALALHGLGRRVAILDADVYGPNIPMLLGVRRRENVDERDAMVRLGSATLEPPRHQPFPRHGLSIFSLAFLVGENQDVLPGNAPVAGVLVERLLFDTDWGEQDYLIVDLPPGTGEPQSTLVARVSLTGVVLVMTPQNTALLDTLRSYQMFSRAGVPILGRIENMGYLICPHCGEGIDMGGAPRVSPTQP